MAERGWLGNSCPGSAGRPRRTQRAAAHYLPWRAPPRKDMALFMRSATRSPGLVSGRASLVGGASRFRPRRGGIRGGRGAAAGRRSAAGAAAPLWVPAPLDGLFLGMRFVSQKPVYLRHRLRRQLAQHL